MAEEYRDRIEKMEKRYRLLADNLIDAIWILDAGTMVYEFITPSVEKISGYSPEELIGRGISDRMSPESLRLTASLLAEARAEYEKGEDVKRTFEVEMIRKNGSTYWIEATARFLLEKGNELKIIGVSKDITRRKQAELERDDLIAQLNRTVAEKGQLLKENRILQGLLPICSGCRRIRDDKGKWWPLDIYVEKHTGALLTHTVCDDCRTIFSDPDL